MSSGTATFSSPALPETRARGGEKWARFVEFMLVGGVTLVLFPLAWLFRKSAGLDASEYAIGFLAFYGAWIINDPHFAVTYVLFYKDAKRRALSSEFSLGHRLRYWGAGFVVPAVLAAWALHALAIRSADTLGWMIQLMFLLVGWHYVKQGFGVVTVLAARRGAPIAPRERTIILAHCFAGWAYAWASPAAPAGQFEEKGVVYGALAHPRWLEVATGMILIASTLALFGMLAVKWRREGRMMPLAPLAAFLITVWSWTIYSSIDRLIQYVIPALHSIQYLYFVWLMKRNEARAEEGPPSFGRPVTVRLGILALSALGLGWLLFHGSPALFDTMLVARPRRGAPPDAFGETPFFAAIFVVVNIHHYFMDNVIWRRDNPETRYLKELG